MTKIMQELYQLKYFPLLILFLIINQCETVTKTTKTIAISRCCHRGEITKIFDNDLQCIQNIDSEWKPRIYSKRKQASLSRTPSSWTIVEASRPDCGFYNATVVKSDNYVFLESGNIFYNDVKIPRDRFCIENDAALICLEDAIMPQNIYAGSDQHTQEVRVKKCCGQGGIYSPSKKSCIVHTSHEAITLDSKQNVSYQMIGGFPICPNDSVGFVKHGQVNLFDLMPDGSFHGKIGSTILQTGLYCVEYFLDIDDTKIPHILACPDLSAEYSSESSDWSLKLYAIGLIISVIFLIATLATGFLLPSSHHVLHWRCQTNYVTCLLIGDFCLAVTKLAGHKLVGTACLTIASVMHFFFLAAFFWLNTMCFNIWWTFRDLRPASLEKGQEACRLRLYEIYAWGVPLLIAGTGAIVNRLPEEEGYNFLRPRFGEKDCWFYGDMEIFTYFFGPIGVLLAINLVLFGLTARELTCGLWKREVVKSNTERAALGRVCLKLVVVMGVSWGADVLSWAAGGPKELWYLTDIINTLQGLFIFIVIGCQPQGWAAMKRMWCLLSRNVSGATGNGNHHSSSSHGLPSLGDSITNHTITNTTNVSCKSSMPLETSC
ncbi:probable G-protein coupled receptor Mth-like 1 isoform X2 [Chrysoperla carnea]|uniref:probable G-protein coupled receptor Mth-like 1 isoform X2 n=1 Tax=Chrysoperla carnea TaxID=189513 RepID=UPI001D07FB5C|nr:probable G-protein coupled receptor Mth-like 1 isoform X2 [Chrysoperla carnea]